MLDLRGTGGDDYLARGRLGPGPRGLRCTLEAGTGEDMKIRDLNRRAASGPVSVWPPAWGSSLGPGDKMAGSYDGVLESVERMENRLRLRIKYEGREYAGSLEWEPPPAIEAVETVLKSNLGRVIRAIGDLDI